MDKIPILLIVDLSVGFIFLIFWVGAFIILYHLVRFGVGVQPKRFAAIFSLIFFFLFSMCALTYSSLDITAIISRL